MVKPKHHALELPTVWLGEEVIDTERRRKVDRNFEIQGVAVSFYIKARDGEEARQKLVKFFEQFNNTNTMEISVDAYPLVKHLSDHAECNEGIC